VKRDPELRKHAFHQFYAEFRDQSVHARRVAGLCSEGRCVSSKSTALSICARGGAVSDDVPVAVYDGLIQSVRANLKPLFRYFDFRRRALGLPELHPLRHVRSPRSEDPD